MKSLINPTIFKLEQYFFIACRISYSTNVIRLHFAILECYIMGNMRRLLKINVDLKKMYKKMSSKSQDVFHNMGRVRDSEHNKKETLF